MYTKRSYINRLRQLFDQPWIHPIYVSHHQYERTLKLGLQPDKRRVLYSCTDTDFFTFKPKSIDPSKSTYNFLQVGRLVEGKGHEFTLLAFQRFLSYLGTVGKNATLSFAGGGELETSLRQKCNELGLSGQVKFFQSVSQRAVMAFLQDTDFFLHPSLITSEGRIEGIPNAIMEALASGVPVIATKHPGIDELMCSGGALFMVQEWNVAEYADTMIRLAEGKLQYDLGKSRKMIEDKFSANQHIAQLLGFYEQEVTL
jgi:colanic acid/amylovoran biosynthesis glycosyltransferase